jgi:energy-coupling factor transporter ATP-binding protein EcfA2
MQFTRLRLIGFKSFVEPSEFLIEPGLTGVVGPNGCGKSNLVEALRWVMGESSHKAMRAPNMDDVIFAGTSNRPGRNMAEVVLTIDNSDRTAPEGLNEDMLEISRRIEREAGSAYRVNGREVRARDVQLLFADASTGLALARARAPGPDRRNHQCEARAAPPPARGSRRHCRPASAQTRSRDAPEGRRAQPPARRRRDLADFEPDGRAETAGPSGFALQERFGGNPQAARHSRRAPLARGGSRRRRGRARARTRGARRGRTDRRTGRSQSCAQRGNRTARTAARRGGRRGRSLAATDSRPHGSRARGSARQGAHRGTRASPCPTDAGYRTRAGAGQRRAGSADPARARGRSACRRSIGERTRRIDGA